MGNSEKLITSVECGCNSSFSYTRGFGSYIAYVGRQFRAYETARFAEEPILDILTLLWRPDALLVIDATRLSPQRALTGHHAHTLRYDS